MENLGLTQKQAEDLLKVHGLNEIKQARIVQPWKIFLSQLTSPLIVILLLAALVSIFLKEYSDAVFIIMVVFINSFLGFYQEFKAENTLEKLKKSVSKTVSVFRSGKIKVINTTLLVPGDVILLEPGLRIPADCQVIEANELLVEEAVLTGESEPVVKNPEEKEANSVYMGTTVVEGLGKAEVKTTGDKTRFGEIARSLREDLNPVTPIKLELIHLSRLITVFVLFIICFIFVLGIINGLEFGQIFLTAVALGVSTIPEGLIISLTVTLALGMNRLLVKKALIKNLPAAETLGDVDVLCIDKTGTLTYGNMQVADYDFVDKEAALAALAISNNEYNFIDKSILSYLDNTKGQDFVHRLQRTRLKLFPFSSERKYTGAYDGKTLYAVGAPEKIISFSKGDLKHWEEKVTAKAKQGNRMLAVCKKELTATNVTREDFKDMKFLGLVFIKDPIRESVGESIKAINKAGIQVKVITGDLKDTAVNILTTIGIDLKSDEIISGQELAEHIQKGNLSDIVSKIKLFYRTTPDQKLAIVRALQQKGLIVGMMGDGVNDSPALKASEIGLVVDNATDVSKEVADLILLDSNFATIESAVEEGRNIIQNLKKIITFLLADSMTETVLILLALVFGYPLPLTPILLLWINIIEDGLPSLALAFEKSSSALLLSRPRKNKRTLLDKKVISLIVIVSLIKDLIFFVIYSNLINNNYTLEAAQTFIYAGISFSSLLFLFSAKTIDTNIWKEPVFNNRIVNLAFIMGNVLLLLSIYFKPLSQILGTVALSINDMLFIVAISLASLALIEVAKWFLHKKIRN